MADLNLGLIGNCQYSALISPYAEVKWLCWPRFDSSCVFGNLVDNDQHQQCGQFSIQTPQPSRTEQAYVQNTNILRTTFRSETGSFEVIDFAPRFIQFDRMFKPTQMVRILRPLEGQPQVQINCQPSYDYGKTQANASLGSNHIHYSGLSEALRLSTDIPLNYVQEQRPFVLSGTKHLVLSWGRPFESPLAETCENYFQKTKHYWQNWVKHCTVPNHYQDEVIRSALVLKLHQFEDTGAITAATTTSIPEFQGSGRNWDYRYCWLRDAYFSLSALSQLGHFEEMEKYAAYVRNLAEVGSPEKLQPVYGILGETELTETQLDHLQGYGGSGPVRIGNDAYTHVQNDIYGETLLSIAPLFLDRRFVTEGTEPPVALVEQLLSLMEKYLEVKDAGIWEFRNCEQLHSFSVLMHWLGAQKTVEIAKGVRRQDLADRAQKVMQRAKEVLDQQCWNEEKQCYVESAGGQELDASLFAMINLGYLHADHPRALLHLRALEKELKINDLIFRYLHQDDFGKPTTTFTVCGLWYVEALARLGQRQRAKELFEKYLELANPLGLMSEDIHPETLQQWGNFPQTYSHVGIINCAFQLEKGSSVSVSV